MPTGHDGSTPQAACHPKERMWAKRLCKACYFRKYNGARVKTDVKYPSHSRAEKRKARLKGLGWTPELWDKTWKEQAGRCANAACRKVLNLSATQNSARACADHEHSTLSPRGILCSTCNIMLGQAQDDPKILRGGAAYLEKFSLETAEETQNGNVYA